MNLAIKDYTPEPHECTNTTGGSRCDICFGGLPYGNPVVELTVHGPLNITSERRAELVTWLETLTKVLALGTDFPQMKKTFTFYEGAS